MGDEQIRDCQACYHTAPCEERELGPGVTMWLCADNVPRKTCIDAAGDQIRARIMIDEHFAFGYAIGRHDAGDARARARETQFAEEYGRAIARARSTGKPLPSWAACFELWLATGKVAAS